MRNFNDEVDEKNVYMREVKWRRERNLLKYQLREREEKSEELKESKNHSITNYH